MPVVAALSLHVSKAVLGAILPCIEIETVASDASTGYEAEEKQS
jgi:hypothetical protein